MGLEDCRGTKFAQPSWLQQAILGSCLVAFARGQRHIMFVTLIIGHRQSYVWISRALLSIGPVQPNAQCRGSRAVLTSSVFRDHGVWPGYSEPSTAWTSGLR